MDNMYFSSVVNNIQMEVMLSQIFHIGPSFLFYDKKRVTFCNCNFDIYSSSHKKKAKTKPKL